VRLTRQSNYWIGCIRIGESALALHPAGWLTVGGLESTGSAGRPDRHGDRGKVVLPALGARVNRLPLRASDDQHGSFEYKRAKMVTLAWLEKRVRFAICANLVQRLDRWGTTRTRPLNSPLDMQSFFG
jgi:hypothetical protein